ncbi:MAG: PH domain-containing protein [Planctomycetota bacterium]
MSGRAEPVVARRARVCGREWRSDIGVLDADDPEVMLEERLARMVALEPGEIVILVVRPHALLLAANMLPTLLGLVVVGLLLAVLRLTTGQGVTSLVMAVFGFALVGGTVLSVLEYRARLYVLTDRRVIRRSGWSRTRQDACVLGDIQSVDIEPETPEGIAIRVGNLMVRSVSGVLPWQYVPDPLGVRKIVLDTIRRYAHQQDDT